MDNLNDKKNYYFISPHLDDAILSAGGLIYDLKDKGEVKIVTIFTKASRRVTRTTQEFIKQCNYLSGDELFLKRKSEDKKLCQYLNIKCVHLDFIDAIWRDERSTIKKEQDLETAIINKLKKIINDEEGVVFAPLSIGNHVDHKIINKICSDNFTNVIYWEDYPYNLKSHLLKKYIKKNNFLFFEHKKNLFIKEKLIKFYDSQVNSLFGDKPIVLKKERYYFYPT